MTALGIQSETHLSDEGHLVTHYASLVKRLAYHLMSRLPASIQADDLIQAGMIGLLEASRHYDASQGASFETYAGIRIRGAMLDEIRKSDWTPRSVHRKVRQISDAIREIECAKGRDARDAEVADKLGISLDDYHQVLQNATGHKVFSVEDLATGSESITEGLCDRIAGPLDEFERGEFKEALGHVIGGLPERERLVMALYYDEELNLREIGMILNVSESRVCQIHGQALLRIKARMREWREEDHEDWVA